MKSIILKGILALLFLIYVAPQIFSQDIGEMLDDAKDLYTNGQLQKARAVLNEVGQYIDADILNMQQDNYQEVKNWNFVKINPQKWEGSKVKVIAKYLSIDNDSVTLLSIGSLNRFADIGVAEKIAGLIAMKNYTWYGEIILAGYEKDKPALFIEHVE